MSPLSARTPGRAIVLVQPSPSPPSPAKSPSSSPPARTASAKTFASSWTEIPPLARPRPRPRRPASPRASRHSSSTRSRPRPRPASTASRPRARAPPCVGRVAPNSPPTPRACASVRAPRDRATTRGRSIDAPVGGPCATPRRPRRVGAERVAERRNRRRNLSARLSAHLDRRFRLTHNAYPYVRCLHRPRWGTERPECGDGDDKKPRRRARAARRARERDAARRDARDAVRERSKPGKLGVGDGLPSTHAPGVPERARGATPRAREARRATTRTLSERLIESKRFEREPR